MSNGMLKIAIQKSGRLYEDSVKLLKDCGIGVRNGGNKLKIEAENFPMEVFFLRDDDIPQYVEDGVADIGIVGENVLYESEKRVSLIEKLGFGKCRLSLAVPRNSAIQSVSDLNRCKIATSYPNLVKNFLKKNNIEAEIHVISGSVEIAPGIGLSDAIADLVSSGSTLMTNGLREMEVILHSEAVLIKNKNLSAGKLEFVDKLLFRIKAVMKARGTKYVLLNAPNNRLQDIIGLLPGMKSPTVMPLAEPGWSSVHSVLNENEFWDIIEKLKDYGAQGILVIPIEKMVV